MYITKKDFNINLFLLTLIVPNLFQHFVSIKAIFVQWTTKIFLILRCLQWTQPKLQVENSPVKYNCDWLSLPFYAEIITSRVWNPVCVTADSNKRTMNLRGFPLKCKPSFSIAITEFTQAAQIWFFFNFMTAFSLLSKTGQKNEFIWICHNRCFTKTRFSLKE